MSDIQVISADTVMFDGRRFRCAIGKNGFTHGERKEGSNTTPLGRFALRECWYRPDRLSAPATVLPLRRLRPDDGWCDDSAHPQYNRHVKLPFGFSHEILWRDDDVYNIIVPLGFNDSPVMPGLGSAIFLHLARPDYSPTEGCVAISLEDMTALLGRLHPDTHMLIRP